MPHYVGLDVSKYRTSICVLDDEGAIAKEGSVPTEPRKIIGFLRGEGRRYRLVGVEAMSLASWIYEHLSRAGLPVVCIEARHAHAILKERVNKTDRNDAYGIAEIMRSGHYKPVHVKTAESQNARLVLATRRLLAGKRRALDNLIRGLLLQFGKKLAAKKPGTFVVRTRKLSARIPALRGVMGALMRVRNVMAEELAKLDATVEQLVSQDAVCRRLMTVPGVGPIAALSYRTAIDLPERFARSRDVGAHLGLTPRTFQSGVASRQGHISKCGDRGARSVLFLAAKSVLSRRTKATNLQVWGRAIAGRRGYIRAVVAVARRLAVVLHRMWLSETDFCREQIAG